MWLSAADNSTYYYYCCRCCWKLGFSPYAYGILFYKFEPIVTDLGFLL